MRATCLLIYCICRHMIAFINFSVQLHFIQIGITIVINYRSPRIPYNVYDTLVEPHYRRGDLVVKKAILFLEASYARRRALMPERSFKPGID